MIFISYWELNPEFDPSELAEVKHNPFSDDPNTMTPIGVFTSLKTKLDFFKIKTSV